MKYKTIMLDMQLYARLSSAKSVLSSKGKRELSFGDFLKELLANRMDILNIDPRLKHYIARFSEELRRLPYVQGAILFGSVARESFTENSDIDVLVMVDDLASGLMAEITGITRSLDIEAAELMAAGLPSMISPIFLTEKEVEPIRPIFFDIVDYGFCLFEKNDKISRFRFSVNRVKHRRELLNDVEVLTWQ